MIIRQALETIRDAHRFNQAAMSPTEVHSICHDALEAPAPLTTPWRVGEFWSSSRPGTVVRCLAEGSEIEAYAKRSDFIRWCDQSAVTP